MKQSIRAVSGPIHARVTIPGSKSITNRALLLSALAEGVSELFDILLSDDTRAFIEALRQLGIVIQVNEETHSCIVAGGSGRFPKFEATIWCADAGTAERFLLAACASSYGTFQFDASPQLRYRPIAGLLRTLSSQGAKITPENAEYLPLTITATGGLRGGDVEIDGADTSQFISAMLMAAPLAKTPMILNILNAVSRPYIDMTCGMMADFGVIVRRMHNARFSIPTPQMYAARDYVIEPDLSTASYFFGAAAVTAGEVTIQMVERENSKQGDVEFLTILEKMGCTVTEDKNGLHVQGVPELKGVSVDMSNISDTFMTLAAIAPFANSPTTITNIGHTRYQESNRITAMRLGLEALQVKVEEGPDWIRVYPSTPQAGVVDSHQDHRIAMAFSVIGLRIPGVIIDGAECVTKTCPEFFTLWEGLH